MHKGLVVLAIVAHHAVQAVHELLGLHSKEDLGQVQRLQERHSQAVSRQEKIAATLGADGKTDS